MNFIMKNCTKVVVILLRAIMKMHCEEGIDMRKQKKQLLYFEMTDKQKAKFKKRLEKKGLIMPSQLPNVKIRYRELMVYAREKGVSVPELTVEEINRFTDRE